MVEVELYGEDGRAQMRLILCWLNPDTSEAEAAWWRQIVANARDTGLLRVHVRSDNVIELEEYAA